MFYFNEWLDSVEMREDKEGSFKAEIELPGVKKQDVKIFLKKDVISIEYKKKDRCYNKIYHIKSGRRSSVSDVEADMVDGILYLTIKYSDDKGKEISIR